MSGLGELDRPETPRSPGAWDERSRKSLTDRAPGPGDAAAPSSGDGGAARGGAQPPSAVRRAAADPVKALMHRHRDLCERAVDPLEIAAGLEAHGVTDRTAARFRHRDVFSLAEEMYARVPRDGDAPSRPTEPPAPRAARAAWIVLAPLPGVLCAAAVAGLRLTEGRPRLIAAAVGALAVALALRAVLRRGPLRAAARTSGTWTCWLVGYALLGDGLLHTALTGGPDALPDGTAGGPWPVAAAPVLALALSCVPAAVGAHLFTTRARRRLTSSRGLADFSASVRPLLLGVFALYTGALAALLALTGAVLGEPAAYPQALTLGALLLLARLLTVHGHAHAATLVLTAAAAAEATALATVFAGRLPGCGLLAAPVEALVAVCGPAGVPAAACGVGALTLLAHATRRLTRASAHAHAHGQTRVTASRPR
ncbi:hypothetical protein IW294_32595 [Streptomyces olivaceus]|uniref:hypothetical protein n=1 Tax=Streptomyces olivaceus TaxID=47716 RepID=UPI0018A84334|nr:hypothetical protein [Streptomyces olivaceus]MBF8175483.1 hypothetical protein [Streptomyces olivaceus]